jgi:hypothetical protein
MKISHRRKAHLWYTRDLADHKAAQKERKSGLDEVWHNGLK